MISLLGDIPVVGRVDLTPTWSALVNLYIHAVRDGTPEANIAAREELNRMALAADRYQALVKIADDNSAVRDAIEAVCLAERAQNEDNAK